MSTIKDKDKFWEKDLDTISKETTGETTRERAERMDGISVKPYQDLSELTKEVKCLREEIKKDRDEHHLNFRFAILSLILIMAMNIYLFMHYKEALEKSTTPPVSEEKL